MTASPENHSMENGAEAVHARELLAGLYEEASSLTGAEENDFESTRDLVSEWVARKASPEFKDQLCEGLKQQLGTEPESYATISPIKGHLLLRRCHSKREFPVYKPVEAGCGDVIMTPSDARGTVLLGDGSTVMLNGGTRLQLENCKEGHRLTLHAGRLFAWVEKQLKGNNLSINTALGNFVVVGTKFDLNLNSRHEARLVVANGQVNFHNNDDGSGSKPVAVRKGRRLVYNNGKTEVKRLTPFQIRRETSWATGQSGKSHGWLLVLITIIMALGAWYLVPKILYKEDPLNPRVVKLDRQDPLTIQSPFSVPGLTWKGYVRSGFVKNGNWLIDKEIIAQSVVSNSDQESGPKIEITLEQMKVPSTDQLAEAIPSMLGRKFAIQLGTDKLIEKTMTQNNSLLEKEQVSIFGQTLRSIDASSFYLPDSVKPGDSWTTSERYPMPNREKTMLSVNTEHRFTGYVLFEGVEMAEIEYSYQAVVGKFLYKLDQTPQFTNHVTINQVQFRGDGKAYCDPTTGRVLVLNDYVRDQTISGKMQALKKGDKKPMVTPFNSKDQYQTYSITRFEYF